MGSVRSRRHLRRPWKALPVGGTGPGDCSGVQWAFRQVGVNFAYHLAAGQGGSARPTRRSALGDVVVLHNDGSHVGTTRATGRSSTPTTGASRSVLPRSAESKSSPFAASGAARTRYSPADSIYRPSAGRSKPRPPLHHTAKWLWPMGLRSPVAPRGLVQANWITPDAASRATRPGGRDWNRSGPG